MTVYVQMDTMKILIQMVVFSAQKGTPSVLHQPLVQSVMDPIENLTLKIVPVPMDTTKTPPQKIVSYALKDFPSVQVKTQAQFVKD